MRSVAASSVVWFVASRLPLAARTAGSAHSTSWWHRWMLVLTEYGRVALRWWSALPRDTHDLLLFVAALVAAVLPTTFWVLDRFRARREKRESTARENYSRFPFDVYTPDDLAAQLLGPHADAPYSARLNSEQQTL